MAYETGTSTGIVDLLDKFRLFAVAQGWTVNRWVTAGSGRELCIAKSGAFFNFRAYVSETVIANGTSATGRTGLSLNGSDGYDAGLAWDRQPGYPLRNESTNGNQGHAYMPLVISTGPFPSYHFFAPDDKTLYCELEFQIGSFLRFGCGSLDLLNPAAPGGGRFFYATGGNPGVTNSTLPLTWLGSSGDEAGHALELVPFRLADYSGTSSLYRQAGSYVRAAFGSFDNWACSGRSAANVYTAMGAQGGGCHDKMLRACGASPLNGTALLLPNIVSLNIANQYLSPIGVMPGLRYMDMTNFLPGDEFTFGPDTWKVFPWYTKGGNISGNRGIALLKN